MPYVNVNGTRLHYEERGQGDPLLWVAGTGIGGGVWDVWQTPHFEKRYRCVTFDLRGAGRSDSPEDGYSVRTFAEDTVGLVEHLDLPPAHFAGVSLGSAIIQELALGWPELVRSATLISTWSSTAREHHIRRWFEARLLTLRSEVPIEVFRAFSFWMSGHTVIDLEPDVQALVEECFAANSSSQPLHAYIGHFDADMRHDTTDRLGGITCPTLVVYGDEDLITLPRYNETVAAAIPGARRRVIPKAGHFMWVERGAELNEVIDEFLSDVESTEQAESSEQRS